jgi:PhnB protein
VRPDIEEGAMTDSGGHTITLHIVVRAGEASEWYQRALGAEESRACPGSRREVHADRAAIRRLRGDDRRRVPEVGVLSPLSLGGTYGTLTLATDDADALWQRAIDAGAEVFQPLQDAFWGDRHGQIVDPFGHRWGIAQHLRDVPADDVAAAAAAIFADLH